MEGPVHILVVEDHRDSAQLFERLLARDGWHVSVAGDYARAMRIAQNLRVDVLVCDIGLPDGDGCQLLREMRSMYPVKALAATGYAMPAELRRVEQAGFDAYLIKPFEFPELLAAVESLTRRAVQMPAAFSPAEEEGFTV